MLYTMALAGRSQVPQSNKARQRKLPCISGENISTPSVYKWEIDSLNGRRKVNIFGF